MRDRDNDDFEDIPSMVPSRDEVVSRQRGRRQPDIVKQNEYIEKVRVSTWPVRIMLAAIVLIMGAGGAFAYNQHQQTLATLEHAQRLIADLENRLAMVGDTTEETAGNILERVDFNFSEIDKLWAARNATNRNVQDLTGRVALVETAAEEHETTLVDTNQRLVQTTSLVEDTRSDLNGLRNELEQTTSRLASLNTTVQQVQGRTQELMALRESLDGVETVSGGVSERLTRVEEAVEAIDAYRLQMNQTIFRLQQNIEAVQSSIRGS
jgi:chromosome segregation ATPase